MAGVPLDKYAKHRDALLADQDNWELTNRPAMLPFLGEYTNKNTGEKSGGFAWPSMVTEPVNAYKRLTDAMRGDDGALTLPNPQNPDNKRDMVTALLGMYGGNVTGGLARRVQRSAPHLNDGPEAPFIDHHRSRDADTIIKEEKAYRDALANAAHYKNSYGNTLHADTGRPSLIGSALAGQYGENAAKSSGRIKAYHGSPHDFDRFSIDKIGSGEGAQVYGHGLYLAEKEGVARSYRDALAQSGSPMYSARNDIVAYGGDVDAALANAQRMVDKGVKQYEPVRDYIRAMKNGEEPAAPGRMYEVNINADPDHFIDWDKPFADQPPAARSVFEADPSFGASSSAPDEFMRQAVKDPHVASRLRDAGVPGVKYLDQNSRIKGEGSRNYVVFDENLIEIMRKYGLLPPAVAASQMFPDDENTF